MAAHDTGMLEGFLRFAVGVPDVFCSPAVAGPMFAVQVGQGLKGRRKVSLFAVLGSGGVSVHRCDLS